MFSDQMVKNISRVVDDVRRLFLVERFVDSIKVSAWAYLWGFFGIQTPKRILFFYKILIKTHSKSMPPKSQSTPLICSVRPMSSVCLDEIDETSLYVRFVLSVTSDVDYSKVSKIIKGLH